MASQLDTRCHHATRCQSFCPVHISYHSQRGTSRREHGSDIVDRVITVFISKHVATLPLSIQLLLPSELEYFLHSQKVLLLL